MRGRPTSHRATWRVRYAVTRALTVEPSAVTGLVAVHAPDGDQARVYYCEPQTGRCSCGAPSGPCPHIVAAMAALVRPRGRGGLGRRRRTPC